ncbi:MAG: cytochrome c5 family protein [Burkholderiales bacterium 35-55-47]|jgi:cytochrome c5|uniref:c-type cytochrome n=1 Tax=Limnohabitans sp. TaxID=1907725 RepID=UPI000BD74F55|nr:c-type cytochrome [Limnohabitans sp.]OYY17780.1 MAG: cytochrome c5 family protein [Burkholderiales bacterium 35-55-47]OYZ72285.1 MAG: cytochrome c5 family protein [Burkholderiales bacterium 24-55-52]OZA99657.1 MAG: cytochrome c5 family protein [Burkholderiales bacterium 39-55-53]HQR86737.1 c-type cytochrome [Limnohabitans sp.]HQS27166.1 c-type cytochrome [Limnohabitans sp.]
MSNHDQSTSTSQVFSSTMKAFVLPVVVVLGLIAYLAASLRPDVVTSSNEPEAIAARIQKVGAVEIKDANRAARSGEEVYKAQCSACHATGAAGAPKFGDAGAWGARIGKGYDALLTSALKGKGNMGPQGGGDFEDYEIGRGVAYMANAAGGKFAEPKKPEGK